MVDHYNINPKPVITYRRNPEDFTPSPKYYSPNYIDRCKDYMYMCGDVYKKKYLTDVEFNRRGYIFKIASLRKFFIIIFSIYEKL